MPHDKSDPKTPLITGLAVASVAAVVLIRLGLISYFNIIRDDEYVRKSAGRPAVQYVRLLGEANARLTGGAMPIDTAMAAIGQGQRPAAIAPRASTDMAALQGWMQMTHTLPTELPLVEAPPPPPPPPPPALNPDGTPVVPVAVDPSAAPAAVPAVTAPAAPAAEAHPAGAAAHTPDVHPAPTADPHAH
ncbi:MAG: hypothetical protein Q8Q09_15920 [Deltaproteobacteria bacterium]|nr:hypothetical protein [Deltaproteobacteria bacterium]